MDHRRHVLALYRDILRVAKTLPGRNRQALVRRRAREGFRAHAGDVHPEAIALHVKLAETQLETLHIQAQQLHDLFRNPKTFVA